MNQEEWLYHWKRGFWEGRWDVISRIEQAMSYRGKDIETVLGVIREIKEELAED